MNDAVYGTYLEQAQVRYFDRVLEVPFEAREMVLAHVDVDFRRPIPPEDGTVRIACAVTALGDSSTEMADRVYAGEVSEPAAAAESVQVAWDGDGSRPVPEAWCERCQAFEPVL